MKDFYNPCKTLQIKTKRGNLPLTVFVCSKGRGPGKTFGWTELTADKIFDTPTITGYEDFERFLFENWFGSGDKFMLITRKRGSLGHVYDGVFKTMLHEKYPNITRFYETPGMKGVYTNCFMEYQEDDLDEDGQTKPMTVKKHVGYVVALNAADDVKLVSSMFSDVCIIITDEFQPADNETYLPNEVSKFKRIYKSVARGDSKNMGLRRVPCVFISNTLSIQNPYFVSCGLWAKIQSNTMKYAGDNYVFHRIEFDDLLKKQEEEGIDTVFADDNSGDDTWLNDNNACIQVSMKGCGESTYEYTLISGNDSYGVRYYPTVGLYYIDNNPDLTYNLRMNLYTRDMKPNVPAFKSSMRMINLRKAMQAGNVRFKNGIIKNDCMNILLGGIK